MEFNEKNYGNATIEESFNITPTMIGYLDETRKWTLFLSILGFIGLFFLVIVGLFFSVFMSSMGSLIGDEYSMPMGSMGGAMGFIYILLAVLYFFPIYYLYKFSTSTKNAILKQDEAQMALAFKNLKSMFKFAGILAIIMISLYILAFIGFAIVGITSFA